MSSCADESGALDDPGTNPPDLVCNDPIPDQGHCLEMSADRFGATATLIPRCGWIVIVGGAELTDGLLGYVRQVELYEPKTAEVRDVVELRVGGTRAFHTATLLDDGRVLIAGGEAHPNVRVSSLRSAFVIDAHDPQDIVVDAEGVAMRTPRTGHTATRLLDGRVLLVGGRQFVPGAVAAEDHIYLQTMEIYDPEAHTFTTVLDDSGDPLALDSGRWGHRAIRLPAGDVLITGGAEAPAPFAELIRVAGSRIQVEPYDVPSSVGRFFHTADLMSDERLALAGGFASLADASARGGLGENPVDGFEVWRPTGGAGFDRDCETVMTRPRAAHAMQVGPGRVALAGGVTSGGSASSDVEWISESCTPVTTQTMCSAGAWQAVVPVPSEKAMIVIGGRTHTNDFFGESIGGIELIPMP